MIPYNVYFVPTEPESISKAESCVSDSDTGVDIENDDNMAALSDAEGGDHDPNDMSRPRKIRR